MSKVFSAVLVGMDVRLIEIETYLGRGFSGLTILGLPAEVARDMRERVRAVLESRGINLFSHRVVVSCGPVEDLRLARTPLAQLEFAVAAGVVRALDAKRTKKPHLEREVYAGALGLDGQLRQHCSSLVYEGLAILGEVAGSGVEPAQIHLPAEGNAHLANARPFILHQDFSRWFEVRDVPASFPERHATRVVDAPAEERWLARIESTLRQFRTRPVVALALSVAAAGRHNLLLCGAPGVGKTFAAHRLHALLPPLAHGDLLAFRLLHASEPERLGNMAVRPFRNPHHTSSAAALVGGADLRPGEASLAHGGVLCLDELAEFSRPALEALREPLDSGRIVLARAGGTVELPARFLLCATMNPCGCGHLLSRDKACRCPPASIRRYLGRVSGPLLDRFAIRLWVQPHEVDLANPCVDAMRSVLERKSEIAEFAARFVQCVRNAEGGGEAGGDELAGESQRARVLREGLDATLAALFPEVRKEERAQGVHLLRSLDGVLAKAVL